MKKTDEVRVICVDDDSNVLNAFERLFRRRLTAVTCSNPRKAVDIIRNSGPYAVVISDMKMPEIDGVKLLSLVSKISPESIRIMLTGVQDQQTAIDAVNKGQIFRFLSKPCSPEILMSAVTAAVEQYRLVTSERVLLEKTLNGAVQMLTDILSLTNPMAFSRAMRLRKYASQLAGSMQMNNPWQVEMAAMLSQIGYCTIPEETLEKVWAGETLSDTETHMLADSLETAARLVANIPRLETISEMIKNQNKPLDFFALPTDGKYRQEDRGAHILKVCNDFDLLMTQGFHREDAILEMRRKRKLYDPEILDQLHRVDTPPIDTAVRAVKIENLRFGMVLAEDILTKSGLLVVPAGHEVNHMLQKRLENFQIQNWIEDQVRVSFPV